MPRRDHDNIVNRIWDYGQEWIAYVIGFDVIMDGKNVCAGYLAMQKTITRLDAQELVREGYVAPCKPIWNTGDLSHVQSRTTEHGRLVETVGQRLNEGKWRYKHHWRDIVTIDYSRWCTEQKKLEEDLHFVTGTVIKTEDYN